MELAEQLGEHCSLQAFLLADLGMAFGDLLRGRTTVDRELVDVARHLLFQPADALHHELVEVGRVVRAGGVLALLPADVDTFADQRWGMPGLVR